MNLIPNSITEQKYRRFLFVPADLWLMLVIGKVSIYAVGHPYKGVVLNFESITPRKMCQYEVCLPERCSIEQIAGLI
jgi:hypothetical protein